MSYELIAAVDLGSNSFRLEVGRVVDNQIYTLDSLKDPVRLASGLLPDKTLDAPSQARAIDALNRFGERLRGFDRDAVRAVATNTLRVAKNADEVLARAEAALGFPIEIIAGREEARLIYIGAAHSLPAVVHKRLVVDIGGGSTEFIIGRRFDPQLLESLYMGCVSYSLRYFPNGRMDKKSFRAAEIAAARELQLIAHDYLASGWKEAVGSSGSARAMADLLELNNLNPGNVTGLTREGLERLRALAIKAGSVDSLNLAGMRADRTPVLPGGIAIMSAVFEALEIERMTYADGALRLGVLYDLIGRFQHHDMREATVAHFMRRYQVDKVQAERVERLARDFHSQLVPVPPAGREHDEQFLSWAARLHEIGISVAHNAYHKHGSYILTYADMPGFSKREQARLATLVLGHRGKLERAVGQSVGEICPELLFSLRLAALFCRSRVDSVAGGLRIKGSAKGVLIDLPADWLAANPLTAAALDDEVGAWARGGFELRLRIRHDRAAVA